MSYDSNTKVALLNKQFSKLLLFSYSAGYLNSNTKLVDLLHNYRGVESEDLYSPSVNKLVDAFYLSDVDSVYYDGYKLVFGTNGWYKNVNIHFIPEKGQLDIVDGNVLISSRVPGSLQEYCYMIKSLADEILGKSKDFYAVPSNKGHDLRRTYK